MLTRGEMGPCGEGTVTKNMTNRIKGLAFPRLRTANQFQITQTPGLTNPFEKQVRFPR
jgi:hypothetical protein